MVSLSPEGQMLWQDFFRSVAALELPPNPYRPGQVTMGLDLACFKQTDPATFGIGVGAVSDSAYALDDFLLKGRLLRVPGHAFSYYHGLSLSYRSWSDAHCALAEHLAKEQQAPRPQFERLADEHRLAIFGFRRNVVGAQAALANAEERFVLASCSRRFLRPPKASGTPEHLDALIQGFKDFIELPSDSYFVRKPIMCMAAAVVFGAVLALGVGLAAAHRGSMREGKPGCGGSVGACIPADLEIE